MSDSSSIEWTDTTWNPILGCTRVSPACDNCYAIPGAHMRAANPNPKVAKAFAGLTERAGGRVDWTGQVNLIEERLGEPLRWKKRRRIFVNSMSDLFHEQVPDEYIAKVWQVMAATPQHTYQVLTKRHARMHAWFTRWPNAVLTNLWLGVSVEDQGWADIRIPALLDTPATIRFISAEPLLGPVDLTRLATHSRGPVAHWEGRDQINALTGVPRDPSWTSRPGIDWVIVGGESGPGARPMHPHWPSSLRQQCQAAGVPFFFKQWGEYGLLPKVGPDGAWANDPGIAVANDGTVYQPDDLAWPDGPRRGEAMRARHDKAFLHAMYRVGKKTSGRKLDGQTWDQYPAVTA